MSTKAQLAAPSLVNLPTELLLEAISLIPYTPSSIESLRLVCRQFNTVLRIYEHSMAGSIICNHFPDQCLRKFPGLSQRHEGLTYVTVDELYNRLQILRSIKENCYSIQERSDKQVGWMETRWIQLQGVGLLLLYRLCGCGKQFPEL